jgi:hypothetical protein
VLELPIHNPVGRRKTIRAVIFSEINNFLTCGRTAVSWGRTLDDEQLQVRSMLQEAQRLPRRPNVVELVAVPAKTNRIS